MGKVGKKRKQPKLGCEKCFSAVAYSAPLELL
jgi:hypothetical protein